MHSASTATHRLPLAAALALGTLVCAPLGAQSIDSTAALRAACEESAGHVVFLNGTTKITSGARPPASEPVASGCTLVLGPDSSFETEAVSLSFAGAFVVQSPHKAKLKLARSFVSATSIDVNLSGTGSDIETNLSGLRAVAGSLSIALGDEAKLTVIERLLPGPENALASTGTVQIRGGRKFTASLNEMGVLGPQGLQITLDGDEGLLKIEQVRFSAPAGGLLIMATGRKSQLEMSESVVLVDDLLAVRFAGEDSSLKLKQISAFSGGPGGVLFEAGSRSAARGKLEASEINVGGTSVGLFASRGGLTGSLKLEKSRLTAPGDVLLESGAQGTTEVIENNVASTGTGTRIRVATGPSGSCKAQPNSFSAPVLDLCP